MRIITISRISEKVSHFVSARRFRCRKNAPVRISGAGAFLNVDGVSRAPYLGRMYEDDFGRGPLGVSYASAKTRESSA